MKDANVLYYGDNLDILRRYLEDESVDLVYLDPPFKSDQDYNVLFADKHGSRSAAQIKAFEDTWRWDQTAEATYLEVVEAGGSVADAMRALRTFLGSCDMLAYLAMMAPRLIELRRVMKPSATIYLHCDPTASHYLKMLLDATFGPLNFRNEIVWRRSHPKGHASTRFARNHDVILAFAKDARSVTWNQQYLAHDPETVHEQYSLTDPDGRRYQLTSLLNPNPDRPNLTYEYKGVVKVWRWTKERMLQSEREGRIVVPKGGKGIPRYKRYLDEQEGIPISDFWANVDFAAGRERLGYPTQKPEALLERIISASSNPGDTVLDPFCGCGTTIAVAERLGRHWRGIDITHLAIALMKHRLHDAFAGRVKYEVKGEPVDLEGAEALAKEDPYQFQFWALGLLGARPAEEKKGADRGIDGRLYFHDEGPSGKTKQIIFSVKAGRVSVAHVRDLRGVLAREKAEFGVLVSLEEPTREMRREAATAGRYTWPQNEETFPRLQLLTIGEILAGKRIEFPATHGNLTFKRAPRADQRNAKRVAENLALPFDSPAVPTTRKRRARSKR